jgi:cell filamentation protein, protein adenylyltransferase
MRPRRTGDYVASTVTGKRIRAFVPKPLPPNPPVRLEGELRDKFDAALVALGRLDAATTMLPEPPLFLYSYVRKEAVLSSQIEGTESSLADLLLWELEEAPGVPVDDVVEVSQYVAALDHGLKRLRGGFPLSNRLLREIHGVLMARGRGAGKAPGEFRRTQNWIGGSRPGNAVFVPPPPAKVADCMAELERFLHDAPRRTPTLLKAALAHVQFETIHPFLDGNGRVGRLLITLLLCAEGVLAQPLLYLSLFFRHHRAEYYRRLDLVRTEGNWEAWCEFFAEGVVNTSASAVSTALKLTRLFSDHRAELERIGRGGSSALQVHRALERRPLASIAHLSSATGLTVPTVTAALGRLQEAAIVRELTGRRRRRVFAYDTYLRLLNEETVTAAAGSR